MIYYFSGTGNSEWAAQKIAEKTGDSVAKIVDILDSSDNAIINVKKGETVGLVFPVYAWSMPKPVANFVKLLDIDKNAYSFAVCTCGLEAGYTIDKLKNKIPLTAGYSLIMPDNYIMAYDIDSRDISLEKVKKSAKKLGHIAENVRLGIGEFDVDKGKFALIKSYVASYFFNKYAMGTEPFRSEPSCTACKLCEKNCPTHNITVVDGMPFWGNDCVQCLACIHRCPQKAIQYGRFSKKRGRYVFDFTDEEIYMEVKE